MSKIMKKNDISAFTTTNKKQLDKASKGGVSAVNSANPKKKVGRPPRSTTGEKASKSVMLNLTPTEHGIALGKGAPATVIYTFLVDKGFFLND
jgi:hypothetical protein